MSASLLYHLSAESENGIIRAEWVWVAPASENNPGDRAHRAVSCGRLFRFRHSDRVSPHSHPARVEGWNIQGAQVTRHHINRPCIDHPFAGLFVSALTVVGCVLFLTAQDGHAQTGSSSGPWQIYGTENGEWRSYAGDVAGTKYSPLDQIDASNFERLEMQWEWTSADRFLSRSTPGGGEWTAPLDAIVDSLVADTPDLYRDGQSPNPSRLQATPLMVGGVLYFNTPLAQGVALDRHDRRDPLGIQPEKLRGRLSLDVQSVDPARRGLLDRWRERRAHLLGDRQRPSRMRSGQDGTPLSRLRPERQRHGRRDGRCPASGTRVTRLSQRDGLLDLLATDHRARPGHPRLPGRRRANHQGGRAWMGEGLERANRRARVGLPHGTEQPG